MTPRGFLITTGVSMITWTLIVHYALKFLLGV